MNFVVSAMLAWLIIVSYEVYMMNKDNDKTWEVIMTLAKAIHKNIGIIDDDDEDDDE